MEEFLVSCGKQSTRRGAKKHSYYVFIGINVCMHIRTMYIHIYTGTYTFVVVDVLTVGDSAMELQAVHVAHESRDICTR